MGQLWNWIRQFKEKRMVTFARPQTAPAIIYVSFSAEIIAHTTESLIAAMANCVNQGVREVYLMLSTPGGNVMHGMNLYNVLRALPLKLVTHNVGNVDSIGNAVFLAGAERYACPHSTFMFHGVGRPVTAGMRLEEKNTKETLDSILADQKRIGSIIKDRTKLRDAEIEALFREAQTKDAAFAAGCGIVHQVKDVQIPPGSTIVSLVFQRQGVQ
jgi:ATP-dependent protease ClpP protease subunit